MKKYISIKKLSVLILIVVLTNTVFLYGNTSNTKSIKGQAEEFRGAWVSSVFNLDWPSTKGLGIDQQKGEYITLLDDLQRAGINAVIVQVKPTADALYPSKHAPWSEYLTGTQGKSPGYDPLAFMIEEAHSRNMEFHAWFNPFRVTTSTNKTDKLAANNPAKLHPEWVIEYDNKLFLNPGLPEVRTYVKNTVLEVVKNYDVDAIHFDDYFYPYPDSKKRDFPDQETYKKYGKNYKYKADWRRYNINTMIKDISIAIKNTKPNVQFGISPFGVWRNASLDPRGSDTKASVTSYDTLFADTRYWAYTGWIDYIVPQIYWNIGFTAADYEKTLKWWVKEMEGKPVDLYVGQALYKVGTEGAWQNPDELPNQILMNRKYDTVKGSIYFRAKLLQENVLGFTDRLKYDLYR
ncbi:MAG TPA: family 10 glycosylhydrolase [Epulopiscium sp.]|nr:family 10 glycosylhydrolase [Candidatus Epulonipiscium sp.]